MKSRKKKQQAQAAIQNQQQTYGVQQAYGMPAAGFGYDYGMPAMVAQPAEKPKRRGAGPLAVTLIVLLTLAIGLIGGAAAYYFLLERYLPLPQQAVPATLTLEELDEVIVGTYTYQGEVHQINARQAILDSVSLSAMLNDDGTYDAPTADMILSYARNHILAQAVADEGITVTAEEVEQYMASSMGTTSILEVATLYQMDEGQARRLLTEAAGVKKLRDSLVADAVTPPAAPPLPADGNTEVANAEYAAYIIDLLGSDWDAANGIWANTSSPYFDALRNAVFSATGANYEAAEMAYSVAYIDYYSAVRDQDNMAADAWNEYVNKLMEDGAIKINTLVS